MRSFEELSTEVQSATLRNDGALLVLLADELRLLETGESLALEQRARGVSCYCMAEYASAIQYFELALERYTQLGDVGGMAAVTANFGVVYTKLGEFIKALEYLVKGLAWFQEIGNRAGAAFIMSRIGNIHWELAENPIAMEYMQGALAYHEEVGDSHNIASTYRSIGNVYSSVDNYPEAAEYYRRALSMFELLGDVFGQAAASSDMASFYWKTGDFVNSLEFYNRALELFKEGGSPSGIAHCTASIGSNYFSLGDNSTALEYLREAVKLHSESGERGRAASCLSEIAIVLLAEGKYEEANAILQELDAFPANEPGTIIARRIINSKLQAAEGNTVVAVEILFNALRIAEKHEMRSQQAEIHLLLRDLYRSTSDFDNYIKHNDAYQKITDEILGKETAIKIAMQEKQREIDATAREHLKHMAVLHSTLPKHIADRVARGEVVSDQYENASVIFLDIVGFTSISDRIPSGHVVHLLEQIFTTLDAVCDKHNVVKIKTIGDSYMAVSFESVINAANCALEMVSALNDLQITMPPALGDTSWVSDVGEIQVRIGMHCGPITAGVIGTQRMQYDVWGDTVNVASRMESTSEPGRIHVSEAFQVGATHASPTEAIALPTENDTTDVRTTEPVASTTASYTLTPRGEIEVKGKGSMLTYWLQEDVS